MKKLIIFKYDLLFLHQLKKGNTKTRNINPWPHGEIILMGVILRG